MRLSDLRDRLDDDEPERERGADEQGEERLSHWHTHADNMDVIDKATLKAVGQTLLQVIYEEANAVAN